MTYFQYFFVQRWFQIHLRWSNAIFLTWRIGSRKTPRYFTGLHRPYFFCHLTRHDTHEKAGEPRLHIAYELINEEVSWKLCLLQLWNHDSIPSQKYTVSRQISCRSICTIVILSSYFTWKRHVLFSRLDTWARKSCVTRVPGSSRVVGLAYTTFADNAQIIVLFTVTWSDSDMAGGSQNGMGGGMCTRILFTKPKPNCTAAHHRILDWCPGEVLYTCWCRNWNGTVVVFVKFSSLAAPKFLILTTFGAAKEENVIKMMALPFQCISSVLTGLYFKGLTLYFDCMRLEIHCGQHLVATIMMTSSNGNIFRVTGSLWWESTGHRWIPLTKGQWLWWDFDVYFWSVPEQTVEQTIDKLVIWDAIALIVLCK